MTVTWWLTIASFVPPQPAISAQAPSSAKSE